MLLIWISEWKLQKLKKNYYIDISTKRMSTRNTRIYATHRVLSAVVKRRKGKPGDIAILWLDLKNAYVSIQPKLMEEKPQRHHVHNKITEHISDYYNNFQMRTVSAWHKLESGFVTRCTISATLICQAINIIIKATKVECRGPVTRSGLRQLPIRAYMDDMTITTMCAISARWLLKGIEKHISWVQISFKPSKPRSLVSFF